MRTVAEIDTDIAKIEALMKLGSSREVAKLSNLRDLCFSAKKLIGQVSEPFLMKQLDSNQNKYLKYLAAKEEVSKIEYSEYRKAKQLELEKEFKPTALAYQIKFIMYFIGEVDLVTMDLLHSLNIPETSKQLPKKSNPV